MTLIADLSPPDRRAEAASYFSVAVYGGHRHRPDRRRGDAQHVRDSAARSPSPGCSPSPPPSCRPRVPRRVAFAGRVAGGTTSRPTTAARWLHPDAVGPGVVLAIGMAAFAVFSAFLPDYARSLGLSGSGGLFAVYSAVCLVLRLGGARLPERLGPRLSVTTAFTMLGHRAGAARCDHRAVGAVGRRRVRRRRHGVHVPVADGVHREPGARSANDRGRSPRSRCSSRPARPSVDWPSARSPTRSASAPASPPPPGCVSSGPWVLRTVVMPASSDDRRRTDAGRRPARCRQHRSALARRRCRRGDRCRCPISASEAAAERPSWSHGAGPRAVLPGRHQPRLALRRLLRRSRAHDRHLLPPELPGRHAEARQHRVLPDRRGGPRARLPGVQALPARRLARLAGVGRPRRRRRPGDAADRRRRRRSRGRRRPRHAAALQRSPPQSRDHRRARRRAAGHRPRPAGDDRPRAHRDVVDAVHGDRLRRRVSAASASSTTPCRRCSRRRRRSCGPRGSGATATAGDERPGAVTVDLAVRQPFDLGTAMAFLAARAIPGSSTSTGRRTAGRSPCRNGHGVATVAGHRRRQVRADARAGRRSGSPTGATSRRPFGGCAGCSTSTPIPWRSTPRSVATRARRRSSARRPGLRVPGQRRPVRDARAGRRRPAGVRRAVRAPSPAASPAPIGSPLTIADDHAHARVPVARRAGGDRPGAAADADAPAARRSSTWPTRIALGKIALDAGADRDDVRQALLDVPGHRTVDRRLRADARPRRSRRVPRRPTSASGRRSPRSERRADVADRWRPWRSYAVHHLWAALSTSNPTPHAKE